jgi:pyrophosphate--fructose-6-phosphate 1-phosphotransferase
MLSVSPLQKERLTFRPTLPAVLRDGPAGVVVESGKATGSGTDHVVLKKIFPHTYGFPLVTCVQGKNRAISPKNVRVGVVLSGGQAPGGHNVIAGLFDGLKKANPKNRLLGFLGGPSGILENSWKEMTASVLAGYRNTGGFDLLQSGRTKIETSEQLSTAQKTLTKNKCDALVVVGGDDSNTNAGLLAEYLKAQNSPVSVLGVPKTIDGDLKNEHIETSFGFDTATKIYSELVGNICRDVNSARKYWHFIRLMGRSASHIALEVALKTHPNIVLVGEEILEQKMTLAQVVESIVEVVERRAKAGKKYGVLLVPEGLIEFIPEIRELLSALNDGASPRALPTKLATLLKSFPLNIQQQLLLDRDPHGNVRVSQIETEKLLAEMVSAKTFLAALTHFFGYEGRCGAPSNFDANYGYALGYNAAVLALNGFTGYLSSVKQLTRPPIHWTCGGVPLTTMMVLEKRHGREKPVIRKALTDLSGAPFKTLKKNREAWALKDDYVFPGPIQYFGPTALTDLTTETLQLEQNHGSPRV